jgi:hypothetical protein
MKKTFIAALFTTITLFANDSCPKLDIENITKDEIISAQGFMIGLEQLSPSTKSIYLDVLKAYNKTNESEKYVNSEGLKQLSSTKIWGYLVAIDTLGDTLNYKKALSSIDANNPKWCVYPAEKK